MPTHLYTYNTYYMYTSEPPRNTNCTRTLYPAVSTTSNSVYGSVPPGAPNTLESVNLRTWLVQAQPKTSPDKTFQFTGSLAKEQFSQIEYQIAAGTDHNSPGPGTMCSSWTVVLLQVWDRFSLHLGRSSQLLLAFNSTHSIWISQRPLNLQIGPLKWLGGGYEPRRTPPIVLGPRPELGLYYGPSFLFRLFFPCPPTAPIQTPSLSFHALPHLSRLFLFSFFFPSFIDNAIPESSSAN